MERRASHPYRNEIDGLRAFAVLPVILFHLSEFLLPGGYLGVDVFFVISGYLITSIILREMENGDFSLARFWGRRIRRIVPAASLVILVVSFFGLLFLYRPDLSAQSGQKLAGMFSVANFYFWQETESYWGHASKQSPFLHYWSLSVEEQFYLVYPILLLLILRLMRKSLLAIMVGVSALSLGLFIHGSAFHPDATFYLLPGRTWELGAGGILALVEGRKVIKPQAWAALLGIAMVAATYFLSGNVQGIGLETLPVVAGTLAFLAWYDKGRPMAIMESHTARFIGRISFSLYLWHWPVIVISRTRWEFSESTELLLLPPVILLLSTASYYLVEKPLRKAESATPWILGASATLAIALFLEPRLIQRMPHSEGIFLTSTSHGQYYDAKPGQKGEAQGRILARSFSPVRENRSLVEYRAGGVLIAPEEGNPQIVLLGDSHASMWGNEISKIANELQVNASIWSLGGENPFFPIPLESARSGKTLSAEQVSAYQRGLLQKIRTWQPRLVIVASRWEFTLGNSRDLIGYLARHSDTVLLLESPPLLQKVGNRNFAEYAAWRGMRPADGQPIVWADAELTKTRQLKQSLDRLAVEYGNVEVLPVSDLFMRKTGGVVAGYDRIPWYLDDDHLTDEGAAVAHERVFSAIHSVLKASVESPEMTSLPNRNLRLSEDSELVVAD